MNNIERRGFLKGGAGALAVAAATAVAPGAVIAAVRASSGSGPASIASAGMLRARYAALMDETFSVHDSALGELQLRLVEIKDGQQAHGMEQFSVFFRSKDDATLPGDTYLLRHRIAGDTALLLEPGRDTADGQMYRADFCLRA